MDEDVAQLQEQNKNMFETIIKQEREIMSLKRKIQDQDSELKKNKETLDFLQNGLAQLTRRAFETGAGNLEVTDDEETSIIKKKKKKGWLLLKNKEE